MSFYNNGDIAAQGESWQKMFLPNVGYYHNRVVRIDNVDFILSTLWSRIPVVDEFAIQMEKARAFDPFGHAGFDPSGKIRLTPEKSWRRGSI